MITDSFDLFLFDLDGVIQIGDQAVAGAAETVRQLRDAGKGIRFATNNSRASRDQILEDLTAFGLDPTQEEIVTAAWATARYLAEHGMERVYPIADDGFRSELRQQGITLTESDVDAVVVGLDKSVGYDDLKRAAQLLYDNSEVSFIAANTDPSYPVEDGIAPGTGAITTAIEATANRSPTAIGKPNSAFFELALHDGTTDRAVMIGDSLESDIRGARSAGLDGILVSSMATARSRATTDVEPLAVVDSPAEILQLEL